MRARGYPFLRITNGHFAVAIIAALDLIRNHILYMLRLIRLLAYNRPEPHVYHLPSSKVFLKVDLYFRSLSVRFIFIDCLAYSKQYDVHGSRKELPLPLLRTFRQIRSSANSGRSVNNIQESSARVGVIQRVRSAFADLRYLHELHPGQRRRWTFRVVDAPCLYMGEVEFTPLQVATRFCIGSN